MKKLLILCSVIILLSTFGYSQTFTTVTGTTITDGGGQVWSNMTIVANLIPPNGTSLGFLKNQGFPINDTPQYVLANGSGTFSITLDDNTKVTPGGSFWRLSLCSNTSSICSTLDIPISGVSMNITSQVQAAIRTPATNSSTTITRGYNVNEVTGGNGSLFWRTTDNTLWGCQTTPNASCPPGWIQVGNTTGLLPTASAKGQIVVATDPIPGQVYVAQSPFFVDARTWVGNGCTDGLDHTSDLQTMINNSPNNTTFYFPQGCQIHFSGNPGLTIDSRVGLIFQSEGYTTNACDQSVGAQLIYTQTYAPGNTAIYINRTQRMLWDRVSLILGGHADVGFNVDQVGATPPITTRNYWTGVCVQNQATANSSFRGFQFSATSISNVEDMNLRDTSVACASSSATTETSNGFGYWFGPSANLKNITINNGTSFNCSSGIFSSSGSDLTYTNWLDSGNFHGITLGGFNDWMTGYRGEINHPHVAITNGIGPHVIAHNDFAANATGPVIDCTAYGNASGCGAVTLFNNEIDGGLSSGDWFNNNNTLQGPLFAFGNKGFGYIPEHWGLGSNVFNYTITYTDVKTRQFPGQATPYNISTINNWIRATIFPTDQANNSPSQVMRFSSLYNNTNTMDDYYIQTLPAGGYGGVTASTFLFGHDPNSPLTPWISLMGNQSGAIYSQIPTPLAPNILNNGAAGATTYSYAVVAHGVTGVSPIGPAGTTNLGNATLNTTNYNQVRFQSVAGATSYDVYRTAGGASQGKLATIQGYCSIGVLCESSAMIFNDTGLVGDGTAGPTLNSTGMIQLTPYQFANLPTGIANGMMIYCTDCKNTQDNAVLFDSNAVGSGNGTALIRENNNWRVH